jgi:hypothetical protein
MATDNHVLRVTDLTEVQSDILRQAVRLAREHDIKTPAKIRSMLALEGYAADDIQTALLFWADREVELSSNQPRK